MVPVEPSYDDAEDRRRVVLIVEDDLSLRWPAAEYLRDLGYRVIEGASAEEAIAVLCSGTRVDIVFSDINLKGELSGHSLSRWVEEHHPVLPLLLTSGSRNAAASVSLSATRSFVAKPYVLADVDHRLKDLLSRN
jgi:two-component system, response regulator PdtaR